MPHGKLVPVLRVAVSVLLTCARRRRLQLVAVSVLLTCTGRRCREARRGDWRQRQQAVRQEAVQAKLAQAQAEEDAKLDRFRALLAQGPLQIQKRQ